MEKATENCTKIEEEYDKERKKFQNKAWDTRENISGAREYITKGYNDNKDNLATKIKEYPIEKPQKDKRKLEEDISKFFKNTPEEKKIISIFDDTQENIFAKLKELAHKNTSLLSERIVGAEDSYLSTLIHELNNSSWVASGKSYIQSAEGKCPFCQQGLPEEFSKHIESHFDETYKRKTTQLDTLKENYKREADTIIKKLELVRDNSDYEEYINDTELRKQTEKLQNSLEENSKYIEDKVKEPHKAVQLSSIEEQEDEIKRSIGEINEKIRENNETVKDIERTKGNTQKDVFLYIAYECKDEISTCKKIKKEEEALNSEKKKAEEDLKKIQEEISKLKASLTDITKSVDTINTLLKDNGFTDFKLKETENKDYMIVRGGEEGVLSYFK